MNMQARKKAKLSKKISTLKTSKLNKGWLDFITVDKDFKDYTTEWEHIVQQRISYNPKYLHTRTEIVLLEILLTLIVKGDAQQWWVKADMQLVDLRDLKREGLAAFILRLLKSEKNVLCYLARVKLIGKREHDDRNAIRKRLLLMKYKTNK